MAESVLRKRRVLCYQVAGGATCYYHGDTTQRGIVQILIQGSIFIDGNATMQSEGVQVREYIRAQLYVDRLESAISVSQSHHSLGSVPLASSRSQLLREFIVRVGVGEWENGSCWGALGLVPTLLRPKPGMSPSSIWDAHLLASY